MVGELKKNGAAKTSYCLAGCVYMALGLYNVYRICTDYIYN